eukprot:6057233-Amphidinium_carterae.1
MPYRYTGVTMKNPWGHAADDVDDDDDNDSEDNSDEDNDELLLTMTTIVLMTTIMMMRTHNPANSATLSDRSGVDKIQTYAMSATWHTEKQRGSISTRASNRAPARGL